MSEDTHKECRRAAEQQARSQAEAAARGAVDISNVLSRVGAWLSPAERALLCDLAWERGKPALARELLTELHQELERLDGATSVALGLFDQLSALDAPRSPT